MVAAALRSLSSEIEVPDSGSVRDDSELWASESQG
jgi:hypothetical protein